MIKGALGIDKKLVTMSKVLVGNYPQKFIDEHCVVDFNSQSPTDVNSGYYMINFEIHENTTRPNSYNEFLEFLYTLCNNKQVNGDNPDMYFGYISADDYNDDHYIEIGQPFTFGITKKPDIEF